VEVFGGSKEELLGKHFAKVGVLSPRDVPKILSAFASGLAGKHPTLNVNIKNKKGQEILLECLGSLTRTHDKPTLLVIARDVTERKRMEEALRESEEKYRSMVELASDGIITVDMKGVITSVNTAFSRWTGYAKEEIVGKHFTKLGTIRAEDIPKYIRLLASSLRGKMPPRFEFTYVRKDGTISWGEAHASLIKADDRTTGFQAILRDITERKQMEEKLKQYSEHLEELVQKRTTELLESENRYFVLVEEASDGVVMIQDGKTIFANKKVLEIIGYSRDELVNLPPEKLFDKQYLQFVKEGYDQVVRGEIIPSPSEVELITKTGERVPVEGSPALINYQGRPAVIIIWRDIRERKRLEEQRLRLEKLSTIGELATMVGHDLRNPLQSIENATYYLLTECASKRTCPIPQKANEMLKVISDSVNYADKIIRDLQDFSTTKAPVLNKTDVNKLIKETLSQVQTPKNIQLHTELDHLPEIKADQDQIKRVFLNLTTNAIQAMENGGTLTVSTKKTEGWIEVSFKDTGVGISKENMEKIFTPFFTTRAKGMGMGLPICKKFIEMHGGTIQVECEAGKGTTFTVKLPIQQESGGEKT